MKEEYMEVPCKYCSSFKLIALNCREYNTGLVVVNAFCEHCNHSQKISNNPNKKNKQKGEELI